MTLYYMIKDNCIGYLQDPIATGDSRPNIQMGHDKDAIA